MSKKVAIYRVVLFLSIVFNIFIAILILFWPDAFTNAVGQPDAFPKTWPRHWGAQLIVINILYLPGYWEPIKHRFPNWTGIATRLTFALFFFSQGDGFVPMGLADGAWGLALLFTYLPVTRAARQGA